MNTKTIQKIIVSIVIILTCTNYQVFAVENTYLDDLDYYKPTLEDEDTGAFKEKAEKVLGVINAVGVVCSVIILCIIGIRYILGSVEEKAEYKKTMLGYMIGAVLLFTASTIPNVLYKLGTSIGETEETTQSPPTRNPHIPARPTPEFN